MKKEIMCKHIFRKNSLIKRLFTGKKFTYIFMYLSDNDVIDVYYELVNKARIFPTKNIEVKK